MPTLSMRPGRHMRRIEMESFARAILCILGGAITLGRTGVAAVQPVFRLMSPDLPSGKTIREEFIANEFGCHGGNQSPALKWSGAPTGTRSFAVTMYDPYKPPQSGWWHWIVYDLPASTDGLPRQAGAAGGAGLPSGARQAAPDGDAPQPHYLSLIHILSAIMNGENPIGNVRQGTTATTTAMLST